MIIFWINVVCPVTNHLCMFQFSLSDNVLSRTVPRYLQDSVYIVCILKHIECQKAWIQFFSFIKLVTSSFVRKNYIAYSLDPHSILIQYQFNFSLRNRSQYRRQSWECWHDLSGLQGRWNKADIVHNLHNLGEHW